MSYKVLNGLSDYVTYGTQTPAATVAGGAAAVAAPAVTTAGISALAVPIGIGVLALAGLYAAFGGKKKRSARRAYARGR